MNGLFEIYNKYRHELSFPHFSLGHTGVTDWVLIIQERNGIGSGAKETTIVSLQYCDLSYVLAKGVVMLKDWLLKQKGGY